MIVSCLFDYEPSALLLLIFPCVTVHRTTATSSSTI